MALGADSMRKFHWIWTGLLALSFAVSGCSALNATSNAISKTLLATGNTIKATGDALVAIPSLILPKPKPSSVVDTDAGRLPIDPQDLSQLGLNVAWANYLNVPTSHKISHAVVLGDILVTIEMPTNLFTAVNLRDGTVRWRQLMGHTTDRFYAPFRVGNFLYVNTETQILKIDANTGQAVEQGNLESVVQSGPAVVGPFAIFGGLNGRIFAHDLTTNYSKWAYRMPGGIITNPTANSRTAFVADSKGVYVLLFARDGEPVWKGRTFAQISAPAAMTRNSVLVPSEDQALYALDIQTGRDLWKFSASHPLNESPLVLGDTVLLRMAHVGLYALDLQTGKVNWKLAQDYLPISQSRTHLFVHHRTSLSKLDMASGRTIVQVPTQRIAFAFSLDGQGDHLLLVTDRGRLLKLEP